MDPDGKHVWWEHFCVENGTRLTIPYTFKLPWPNWHDGGGRVEPSIRCEVKGCGYHAAPRLSEPPQHWKISKGGIP